MLAQVYLFLLNGDMGQNRYKYWLCILQSKPIREWAKYHSCDGIPLSETVTRISLATTVDLFMETSLTVAWSCGRTTQKARGDRPWDIQQLQGGILVRRHVSASGYTQLSLCMQRRVLSSPRTAVQQTESLKEIVCHYLLKHQPPLAGQGSINKVAYIWLSRATRWRGKFVGRALKMR